MEDLRRGVSFILPADVEWLGFLERCFFYCVVIELFEQAKKLLIWRWFEFIAPFPIWVLGCTDAGNSTV